MGRARSLPRPVPLVWLTLHADGRFPGGRGSFRTPLRLIDFGWVGSGDFDGICHGPPRCIEMPRFQDISETNEQDVRGGRYRIRGFALARDHDCLALGLILRELRFCVRLDGVGTLPPARNPPLRAMDANSPFDPRRSVHPLAKMDRVLVTTFRRSIGRFRGVARQRWIRRPRYQGRFPGRNCFKKPLSSNGPFHPARP